MSQKAPSFPMIRLDVKPVKWLIFNYQHAWLNSNIIDSTTITKTTNPKINQYNFRDKLLAFHSLTFIPTKGLSITAGESVIYNDGIKVGFLIPVLSFKLVDHYMGGQYTTPNISNAQIFFQLSSRNHIKKTHLYFGYFVDEISLNTLFTKDKIRNQSAYTAGVSISDFIVPNLFINVEYTKIRPYVYVNRVSAQSYKSSDYYLGHWIGPNADQLYTQFQYRLARGLVFKGIFEYVRKGDQGPDTLQDAELNTPFLGGTVRNLINTSIEGQYELTHDMFFKIKYTNTQSSESITPLNTDKIKLFTFGFNYGF